VGCGADVVKRAILIASAILSVSFAALLAVIAKDAPAWWGAAAPVICIHLIFWLGIFTTSDNPLRKSAERVKGLLETNLILGVVVLMTLIAANVGAGFWLWHKANAPEGHYRLIISKGPVQVTGLTVVFKVLDPARRKTHREISTDIEGMAAFPARTGDLLTIRVQDLRGRFATVEPGVALTTEILAEAHPFDIAKIKDEDWTAAQSLTGFVTTADLAKHGAADKLYGARDILARLAPLGQLPKADAILAHDAYVVGYDTRIRQPRWVAYEVFDKADGLRRKSNFTADPLLPRSVQATSADFSGSGYDRGGLVRSIDVATTQDNMDSAFLYTVATPQRPMLNRRLWAWIEDFAADQRELGGGSRVFVIRGPAYLESGAPARGKVLTGANHIPVPTHFFQILAVQKSGGPLTLQCFLAPNVEQDWKKSQTSIDDYRVSRAAIERGTGLAFFTDRPVSETACR
jgi:endonuclease G